ncbi:MAG: hypothetical protein U0930_16080 [Pirellulales bacterium]
MNIYPAAAQVGVQTAVKPREICWVKLRTRSVILQLFEKVERLADRLFDTISYQTSTLRYGASGYERGCMTDYVDYPLNNRWWIEDQLDKFFLKMPSQKEQLLRRSSGGQL